MAATRPYRLVFKGETYIIEAPGAAHAVQHVVGADISELRPARAAEVSAWIRDGKTIPIAGEKAAVADATMPEVGADRIPLMEPGAKIEATALAPEWTDADVAAWLLAHGATEATLATWAKCVGEQRVTLEHYDIIRCEVEEFGARLAPPVHADSDACVAEYRGVLEDNPLLLHVAIAVLEKTVREDLETAPEVVAED